jgi:MFS superfamily sulfate permease-like transporter
MYGKWFLIVFSFVMVVLLVIALIAAAYAPIFAVAIAALIATVFLLARASRRSRQVGSEHASAGAERREADQAARPSATAAPRSGEG